MRPIELGPNQPRQFYLGGQAIAELRGVGEGDEFRPEDWVGSATPRFGMEEDGLSKLPDGRYLRDALEADPDSWLGPEHVKYFGASPALLVKLLDAGQRLPVHVHPNRSFAYRHLGSRHGKTESWVVLGARGADPVVYLGWSRDIETAELSRWVSDQDTMAMLGQLHKLEVEPGDAVLVPAGTPHAIGEGVFAVELQEPTDFSIMLEFKGFDLDPAGGELGLGRELALSCLRQKAFSAGDIDGLRRHHKAGVGAEDGVVHDVMPVAANPYFRAQRVFGRGAVRLEASFAVVVVLSGQGSLEGDGWSVPVKRGNTFVVPWASGAVGVTGEVELLRCLPPLPADAKRDDPAA
ncbi:MAG: class I mannose-6-phosphate isomerase [Acidimicrobiales bacterium]